MRALGLLLVLVGVQQNKLFDLLQEIPVHPDKLKFKPLSFELPEPASMRVDLGGGAVAYLLEDPALPIVDLQVFFRGGAFDQPRGKEGLADLTAALMRTGGTETRSPEALDEELDFLAAHLDVSVSDVTGAASLSVLAKDLGRGLEILADVLRAPAFNAGKLEILKAQTLDQLKARNDATEAIESREASLLFYGDYPLNRLETKASIESLTREDLISFHRRLIHPARIVVAAAGAFKKSDLADKLKAAFRDWPWAAAPVAAVPKVTHDAKPGIYCFHKEGENVNQGRVTIGHLGVDVHNPDVHAIRLMSYILGAGGFSSRLMQKVRTEEGLAYDVGTDFRPGIVYPYAFKIAFQSKSESVAFAAKLCLEEVARIREKGVSDKELGDAIRFYLDAFPGLFFTTRLRTAVTYAQAELLGLPKDYYRTYREKIAKLTVEEIRRAAVQYLKPEKFVWVVVGDIPAITKGDGKHPVTLPDLGPVTLVPLPDPTTLERPK